MLKKVIIAALAVGVLGSGIALAESYGDDDDGYGFGECAGIQTQETGGYGDDERGAGIGCDGEDDDGGTGMNSAPLGAVPPPDNGLISSGTTPSVSVR